MYLSDAANESYYNRPRDRDPDSFSMSHLGQRARARHSSQAYMPPSSPAPPTSIPLDDNFDAPTTEVPTEWAIGNQHPEYDESVSGYRNYVSEMERMLSGHLESVTARAQERQYQIQHARAHPPLPQVQSPPVQPRRPLRRSDTSISESARGSSRLGGSGAGLGGGGGVAVSERRRSLGYGSPSLVPQSYAPLLSPLPISPPPENARKVSGKKGKIELVEQRVLEDSPTRTISLWRERVAASSVGGGEGEGDEMRSETDSHARAYGLARDGGGRAHGNGQGHRRALSGSFHPDARLRRVVSEHGRYGSSVNGGGTHHGSVRESVGRSGKNNRASYERSEVNIC